MPLLDALFVATYPLATATINASVLTDTNQDAAIAALQAQVATLTASLNKHEQCIMVLCDLQRGAVTADMNGVIAAGQRRGMF